LKAIAKSRWFHPLLLVLWLLIGTGLRLTALTSKTLWSDEVATMVFSLGNSFRTVPLNQAIALSTLLQPLQPNPQAGIVTVINHLMTESTHPPAYFALAHLWMKLFPADAGLASVWAARSLPVLLGVVSIPAMFGLGWLACRSRLVGQIAAALMAVSPFSIALAQEARHYTLAILCVIASLSCLVVAIRTIHHRTYLPVWVGLTWVIVNCLGMATHYFFILTLCAEALVLIGFAINRLSEIANFKTWWRIYAVAAGTAAGCLVWLPAWQHISSNSLTQWIYGGDRSSFSWLEPISQALAAWITMMFLLPVEVTNKLIVVLSALLLLFFSIWTTFILYRGIRIQRMQPESSLAIQVLGSFVLGAVILFFGLTYTKFPDLLSGIRYNFVYFPAVIVLLAASLATSWHTPKTQAGIRLPSPQGSLSILRSLRIGGKKAVVLIWLMGLLGGLTVISDLGYHKPYRPDLLMHTIQKVSQSPVLIAINHYNHIETAKMIGLGWEFQRNNALHSAASPQFLLGHQNCDPTPGKECAALTALLQQTLPQLPRPLDLWTVNFPAPVNLEAQNCFSDFPSWPQAHGYDYQLYHCPKLVK
jgi:uncharacterized membrane protein